jgi:Glycosyl hydrolase family 26
MNLPSDPGAAAETKALLEYFYSISGLRTLSGQHSMYWDSPNQGTVLPVKQDQHISNTVGKFPGVYGTDFGDGQVGTDLDHTIELIQRQAGTGRVVTVSYHFSGTRGDLAGVVDPTNTTVRPAFMDRIEALVILLRKLDVAVPRVPVIFRPLHEMNAPWPLIWWGKDGAGNLKSLWMEIWNRFHNRAVPSENIHNVLWMFSANAWLDSGTAVDPPDAYYPGHGFVDMLGADIYVEAGYQWHQAYHDDLRALGANRPIAITESGRLPDFPALRATQPYWVYWLTWRDRYDDTQVGNEFPDNTPARYQSVASDPAVVWSTPEIYLRDFETDLGLTTPSPDSLNDAGGQHWWYESVDIKVDANPISATDLTNPLNFAAFQGESPIRNATNRLYVRVHNRGPAFATNVKLKCLSTGASGGLPELPADYWQHFPEDWTTLSPWNHVDGNAYTLIPSIPPRSSHITKIDWVVPASADEHSCVLAMVTGIGDPLIGTGHTLEIRGEVRGDKHIALRNLHVVSNPAFPFKFTLDLHRTRSFSRYSELAMDASEMPDGRILVAVDEAPGRTLRLIQGQAISFRRIECETTHPRPNLFEMEVPRGLSKARAIKDLPRISGIELPEGCPTKIEIEWSARGQLKAGTTHRLRIFQLEEEAVQGGSTFVFRIPRSKKDRRPGTRYPRRHASGSKHAKSEVAGG